MTESDLFLCKKYGPKLSITTTYKNFLENLLTNIGQYAGYIVIHNITNTCGYLLITHIHLFIYIYSIHSSINSKYSPLYSTILHFKGSIRPIERRKWEGDTKMLCPILANLTESFWKSHMGMEELYEYASDPIL